ncbi:MAG: triple tyrosine motif-containing protein, partial [Pseudomonadota bacterium]
GADGRTTLWLCGADSTVLKITGDSVERPFDPAEFAGAAISWVHPLDNGGLVIGTMRGVYQYDATTKRLDRFGPLQGFVGMETGSHAVYRGDPDALWMGTGSGIARMDVSQPLAADIAPRIRLTELLSGETSYTPNSADVQTLPGATALFGFDAVSTRRPGAIEYSYRLLGDSDAWSTPAANRSVSFSSMKPGPHTFEVRARRLGGPWSTPAARSFVVPTPFWRTPWFIALAVAVAASIIWFVVQWRLAATRRLNRRLKRQVMEAEARFSQAYQNAPIGMGLVDPDGFVYDANPSMKALFWPRS